MYTKLVVRNETKDDIFTISAVTSVAFKTMEISNHTEQLIIEALRTANALTVSLVAELEGTVIGHIAFSPVTISDGTPNWYALGPVSVLPEHQRKGVGKALIQEGLSRLRDMNAQGCCLVGHPDYYRQFGFENIPGLVYEGVPQEVFFALSFDGRTPRGTVAFHQGFNADGMCIVEASDSNLLDVLLVERAAFGHDAEAELVRDLLNDPSASPLLSLLALEGERAVGHVLFTSARLKETPAAAAIALLAPLAVVPDLQRQGVGGKLIERGLRLLSDAGVDLVFVLGHPEYYPRHGFEPAGRLGFAAPFPIPDEHADAWMVQALRPGVVGSVRGTIICADALNKPEYWRE
jgi:putative acetyltransferase